MSSGDGAALAEVAYDLESSLIVSGRFSDTLFDALLGVMKMPDFLKLEGSWNLLHLFEHGWNFLSTAQRAELLAALESSYGLFDDWTSSYVISEILGRLYADEPALAALCRLKSRTEGRPRSLLPHGLQLIVSNSPEHGLSRRAFEELLAMRGDPSEEVRDEVVGALRGLANAGWNVEH